MKSYYRVMIAAMAALLLAGCEGRPDSGSIFAEAEAITALPVQVPAATPVSTETPIPEMTEAPALEPTEQHRATEKPKEEKTEAPEEPKATEEPELQKVNSSMSYNGYDSITVKAGIPVRWNLKVPEGVLTGCNNAIVIPEYGIEKTLQAGDNIIEFTPEEPGTVQFTCWMGMIRSEINVV